MWNDVSEVRVIWMTWVSWKWYEWHNSDVSVKVMWMMNDGNVMWVMWVKWVIGMCEMWMLRSWVVLWGTRAKWSKFTVHVLSFVMWMLRVKWVMHPCEWRECCQCCEYLRCRMLSVMLREVLSDECAVLKNLGPDKRERRVNSPRTFTTTANFKVVQFVRMILDFFRSSQDSFVISCDLFLRLGGKMNSVEHIEFVWTRTFLQIRFDR